MSWRVLITAPYFQRALDRFGPPLEAEGVELVVPEVTERLEEAELLPLVGDVDGAICGDDHFTRAVLAEAPRLRVICKWGTGIDSIDADACRDLGIALRNTPGAFTDPVADTVMGYVVCFARRLVDLDREMKAGSWRKLTGAALRELVLGIIGVGAIGKAVTRRARAFGMSVLGTDIVPMPDAFVAETGIEMTSRDDLLARADIVSVNCTLNPTSDRMMDAPAFARMKRGAVLINTARGPIVVQRALEEALLAGHLSGAALDVFEEEPLPAGSRLRTMPNVLLSPHGSNSSPAAWDAVHERTVAMLLEELRRRSS